MDGITVIMLEKGEAGCDTKEAMFIVSCHPAELQASHDAYGFTHCTSIVVQMGHFWLGLVWLDVYTQDLPQSVGIGSENWLRQPDR